MSWSIFYDNSNFRQNILRFVERVIIKLILYGEFVSICLFVFWKLLQLH